MKYKCRHNETCKLYISEKDVNNIPFHIYKNVFCNRGRRGWENCEEYINLEMQSKYEKNY